MDNSERCHHIYEFISKNDGTTENRIKKYMAQNHYGAADTVRNLLYNVLIPNGKVIDKKIGNSFHRFYVNDKNEFYNLITEINKHHLLADNLARVVTRKANLMQKIKTRFPNSTRYDTEFRNLVHLAQLHLYMKTSAIAVKINHNFKSTDDREVLYLRLVEILTASNKLNRTIEPEVRRGLEEISIKTKDKHYGSRWANIVDEISKIMINLW